MKKQMVMVSRREWWWARFGAGLSIGNTIALIIWIIVIAIDIA